METIERSGCCYAATLMSPMAALVILPLLALLATVTGCDAGAAPAAPSSGGGDRVPWAPENPWAEAPGPIAAYLRAPEGAAGDAVRARALRELASLDDFRRERLGEMLHDAGLFRPLEPGIADLVVPVGHGHGRRVWVRVPDGYDPTRPWPLLLAYHPSGGDGVPMIGHVERLLGDAVEDYVVAAPDHYRQTSLDHPPPVSSEHLAVLHALRGMVHVDGDRVYVTGYSLGGYTAWHLATLHADHFAAAVPMAGTFGFLGGPEGVWTEFLANLRHLPVLSVWGDRDSLDVPGLNASGSAGSMAQVNRRLAALLEEHGAETVIHHRVRGAGHGGARPPRELLLEVLREERVEAPRRIEHWFRYIHQGHAYWVVGHRWQGALWDLPWPEAERRDGESREGARWRAIRDRLGRIRAEAPAPGGGDGAQRFEVESRHLADLTVWLDDGLVDWGRPVEVVHDGRTVFSGLLEPDLGVAMVQVRRTRDFDRLRWAGVRIDAAAGTARPVTPADDFPPVLQEVLD